MEIVLAKLNKTIKKLELEIAKGEFNKLKGYVVLQGETKKKLEAYKKAFEILKAEQHVPQGN